jgi:hypothetical protein
MARLVLDEEAMALAVQQLHGRSVFSAPSGGLHEPRVIDLIEESPNPTGWQPLDSHSRLLLFATEPCRDVVFHSSKYSNDHERRRTMKAMTVPICTLMDIVHELLSFLNSQEARQERDAWSPADQATYLNLARRLRRKHMRGPVRVFRNKLSAHLDGTVLQERIPLPSPAELLEAYGDCLVILLLSTNYPSSFFSWIRPGSDCPGPGLISIQTMFSYPLCVEWHVDNDGRVKAVGTLVLAADPRHEIRQYFLESIVAYNQMAAQSDCGLNQIVQTERSVQSD